MAKTASPMRLEQSLVQAATAVGESYKRSAASQIEYWAEIGRAVERVLDPEAIIAIQSGLARVKLELTSGQPLDVAEVFDLLERDRRGGQLAAAVHSPDFPSDFPVYQASVTHQGMLERVSPSGEISVGHFHNGKFIPVAV